MGDAEKSDPQAAHFRAFVSYSHADAAVAQKLHRKIETYRLPHHLRDRETVDPDHGRLGRIFRDREDLPAAADLSESVKQALAGSQALIVICSPDAKASIWVAREIELFRSLHPDRPVLAALVRGEPEEAFPAPLMAGTEPLAADLRKEGDGWRLGFLKIVAGIAGVPLDALVQRDAARRIRRVMAVTGGALVALLAMIGMTIFAIQSRNEAQHQQAEAEGLVEYMLTDLRTELKGVGRLDVMTDVNERAMVYYEDQGDLSDMPAESLERRARILHAMGEDDEKRGDLDKALKKFTEAHRVTAALLARDPDNPDRIFGHAQSEYWVGRIAELERNYDAAVVGYTLYRKAALKLFSREPDSLRSLLEVAYAENNIGIIRLQGKQSSRGARQSFSRAIGFFQNARKLEPHNIEITGELANAYAWRADTHFLEKEFQKSRADRIREYHLKLEIHRMDPENKDALYKVLITERALALIERKLNNSKSALHILENSYPKALILIETDPKNSEWINLFNKISDDLNTTRMKEGG